MTKKSILMTQAVVKRKGKVSIKKRTSEESLDKAEEKKRKKLEEEMKLDAKNRQLEDMILERRKNEEEREKDSSKSAMPHILPLLSEVEKQPEQISCEGVSPEADHSNMQYWPDNQFSSPFRAFPNYSYVRELMSPSTSGTYTNSASFHALASQRELQDIYAWLERDNEQLKQENVQLRMHLDRTCHDSQTNDVIATPKKVEFLRQLVSSFEKKTQNVHSRSPPTEKQRVYKPTPVRLTYSVEEAPSTSQAMGSERFDEEAQVPKGSSHWEECVTSSGVKKIRLHPEYKVYMTQGQLSQIKHAGSSNARKITLLDALFSKEELSKSSARGSKKAHNAPIATVSLASIAIDAIKQFVLTHFKRDNGDPCLSNPIFNDIINSKCATARRSLNR